MKARLSEHGIADGKLFGGQRFEMRDRRLVLAVLGVAQLHERRSVEEDHRAFDRSFR